MKEDNDEAQQNAIVTSNRMATQYGVNLDLAQVRWVGQTFAASGMFKDDGQQVGEAKAMVKIMAGQEAGIPPFAAMKGINIIKGNVSMSGDLIASKVKSHPKYDYKVLENDDKKCVIEFFEILKDGTKDSIGLTAYTIEMAQRAGLIKPDSNWTKYPEAMLFNRAISKGQKQHCPDVFSMPVYTEDEAQEMNAGYIPESQPAHTAKPARVKVAAQPRDDQAAATNDAIEDLNPPAAPQPVPDEAVDEAQDRVVARSVPASKVDKQFKENVRKSLESLDLNVTQRMRILQKATGKVSDANLTDREWLVYSEAIDDVAIGMADEITSEETPVKIAEEAEADEAETKPGAAKNETKTDEQTDVKAS